jgi:hypothetical protein
MSGPEALLRNRDYKLDDEILWYRRLTDWGLADWGLVI